MHLTLAEMLRTMKVEVENDCPIRINDTINTMLQSAVWSLRTTIRSVTNVSPGISIFGRDMIFNSTSKLGSGSSETRYASTKGQYAREQ